MNTFEADLKKQIAARLEKGRSNLLELELAIKDVDASSVDARVLADFREAVDQVRMTAWTVQYHLGQQAKHAGSQPPDPFLPLLTAERVRRATRLNNDLAYDLGVVKLNARMEGIEQIEDLFRSFERLYRHLAPLFDKKRRT